MITSQLGTKVKASHKYIRVSPYKMRRVADLIRGKQVHLAQSILKNVPHRGSAFISKVLDAAIANASHNFSLSSDQLIVSEILINEGPKLKRFQPRARGRIFSILKRTSHIHITLGQVKER